MQYLTHISHHLLRIPRPSFIQTQQLQEDAAYWGRELGGSGKGKGGSKGSSSGKGGSKGSSGSGSSSGKGGSKGSSSGKGKGGSTTSQGSSGSR